MKNDMFLRELEANMAECNKQAMSSQIDQPEFAYWTGRLSALQSCKETYLKIHQGTPLQSRVDASY